MRRAIILASAILLGACSDALLDHAPETSVTTGNFYKNPADFDKAVAGVYQGMQSWPVDIHFYLSEVRSKNFWAVFADAQRDWYDISNFNTPPNLGAFSGAWARLYAMINRANEVLERIDGIAFLDDAVRERYKSEVRFLRALAYFQLVTLFNRVPLVDHVLAPGEALEVRQSEPDEVFDFIIAEMRAAADALPTEYDAANVGRVTQQAAKGLLARVYMTAAGYPLFRTDAYDEARALLDDVIALEGGPVRLSENFADMFAYTSDNQHHIFEIQFISGVGAGNALPAQVYPAGTQFQFPALISASRLAVSEDMLAEYDQENDLRFDATLDTASNTWYFSKFTDAAATIAERSDYPVNFPLLRYADVLLMHAEAENELNGPTAAAIEKLNRVRRRAGLPDVFPATRDELRIALESERRKEFAFEGLYWFDLRRTNRGVTVMNEWFEATSQDIAMNESHYDYPIPLNQIDVFPELYEQNPGY